MDWLAAKYLKMVLSIAGGVYSAYTSFSETGNNLLSSIGLGFFIMVLIYLFCSLYGFSLAVTANHLLAAIASVGIVLVGCSKLSECQQSAGWLSNEVSLAILVVIAILLFIRDIRYIKARRLVGCADANATLE